jgi:WD40 repeat protein
MGVVYKARHLGLKRLVALKMIKSAHVTDQDRNRFRAEAEAVARLQHPNIVQVFDVGEYEGQPYCALELADAGSLDHRLRQGTLTPRDAADLIGRLALAMDAAHALNVVHRDLKPANVLLTADGTPKVTDFGLAKFLDGAASGLTQAGEVLGTPSYMAPEQAAGGREVGPAADVYALGAILYEALTGRPPFREPTVAETLARVRDQDPVPPARLRPGCPRDLETVCLKCLEKEPARRYRSAAALADDLRRFREGRPVLARRVGPLERGWRWCRRQPALAALSALCVGAVLALLAGGFWYSAHVGAARGDLAAAQAETAAAQAETDAARRVAATQEFYALLNQARENAVRRQPGWTRSGLDDLTRAARLPAAADHLPALRTEMAACLAGVDVYPGRVLRRDLTAACLAFDPAGRWLALGQFKAQAYALCSVLLVDPAGGGVVRPLPFLPSFSFEMARGVQDGARSLAFSPDGRWLVAGTRSGRMHRWDLSQEPPRLVSWQGHQGEVNRLAFSPDGKALFSASDDRTVKRWDPAARWRETARHASAEAVRDLAVSPAGDWVACPEQGRVRFLACATLGPNRRSPLTVPGGRLAVAPDGRMLAVAEEDVVRLLDLDGGRVVRVLGEPGDGVIDRLAFSPDGALLVSTTRDTDHVRLWEVAGGRLVADLAAGADPARAAFHPNGRALAVLAGPNTLLHELGGLGEQTFVALQPHAVRAIALSPDGRTLATVQETAVRGRGQVEVWDLACRGPKGPGPGRVLGPVSLSSKPRLVFDPAGKGLACSTAEGVTLWGLSGGSAPRAVPAADVSALAFAPDGRLWGAAACEVLAWEVPRGRVTVCWSNALSNQLTGLGTVRAVAAGRRWVVVGGRDGMVRVLRPQDGKGETVGQASSAPVSSVALTPDETLAAVGTWQGGLRVLRVPDGHEVADLSGHRDSVEAVACAGRLLASGSRDGTIRLWRCAGGAVEHLLTLRAPGPVQGLAFSPAGPTLAVLVHKERGVRLWHLGRLRARLAGAGLDPGPSD